MARPRLLLIVAAAALAGAAWPRAAAAQRPVRDATDADVDRAIARTVRWLWGRQTARGLWPDQSAAGGSTALALFALLEAGENPHQERFTKGLDALCQLQVNHCYVRALRVMVLAQIGGKQLDEKYRKVFLDDLKWLGKGAAALGAWTYTGADRYGDNSCSQFALLALHEASRCGEALPHGLIGIVQQTWLKRQQADGGWTYAGSPNTKGDSTASMTAAGVASLFLCQDATAGGECRPYAHREAIDRGLAYLADHLADDYIDNGYLAFCVQRVGLASGLKFLGQRDWYAAGARVLVKPQPFGPAYRGQWGPDVRASFELTFLARGRIPLVFNKLAHGPADPDLHPRDVAQFAEYMRRTFERRMRWQVVNTADDIRLLLDAPILLITGKEPPALTDAQWLKLREYSLRGGLLLFMPTHDSRPFVDAVAARLDGLYTPLADDAPPGGWRLAPLAADDPIYSAMNRVADGPKVAPLRAVSDGTRPLALLCERDLGCSWQRFLTARQPAHFEVGVNLFLFATGANEMGSRLRPVFVGADREPRSRVKVAWLRHDGNWHTQPYALDILSQKLTAENYLAIDLTAGVRPGDDPLDGYKYKLLWLTGTDAFEMTDAQVAALRAYLDGGGVLFANAVGGAEPFAASADKLIGQLARPGGQRGGLAGDSPLLTGKLGEFRGLPLTDLKRVRNWKLKGGGAGSPLEVYIEGGWPRIIFARHGVHDTIDGHVAWSAMSYMPADAAQIAANVALYALMDKPPPPPATQPDEAATP